MRSAMSDPEYIEIDVETIRESKSGLAVWFTDGDREFCIPKSVMDSWPDEGESGTAMVEEWFAIRENLA